MALSFIGKPISLISHSDVRYRGILAGIDPSASTIQLSNVYSMGTESRRPPNQFIPPVQEPYAYIIFRASEVKDLAVDEPTPRRNVHDDPAVLGASAPIAPGSFGYPGPGQPQPPNAQQPPQAQPQQPPPAQPPQQQQQRQNSQQRQAQPPAAAPTAAAAAQPPPSQQTPGAAGPATNNNNKPPARNNAVNSATVSLETVGRALGDLRVSSGGDGPPQAQSHHHVNNSNHHHRGGARRGGYHGGRGGHGHDQGGISGGVKVGDLRVPTTDFDFASSNAKFDKAALGPRPGSASANGSNGVVPGAPTAEGSGDVEDGDAPSPGENGKGKEKEVQQPGQGQGGTDRVPAYDKSKSFFDTLSSGSNAPTAGDGNGRGRGGRRGGGGRNRREEERERNVATFGEPGGIGLMGPGAYVGGWGGYGRRGGGRGRRGGAAVGAR